MSNGYGYQRPMTLQPIGFEEFAEEPIRPLKKKRKRNKLKTLALANRSFGGANTGYTEPGHPQLQSYQQAPHIASSPNPELLDSGKYLGLGELRLRKNNSKSQEDKAKRFTISDLEGHQPEWLRQQSVGKSQMARQDVRDLLRKLYLAPEKDRIDYVILHKIPSDPGDVEEKRKAKRRQRFEKLVEEEGFSLEHDIIGEYDYCKLHCSFQRLCKEAERVKLELPLKSMMIEDDEEDNGCTKWIDKTFVTDIEVDFVSAPFEQLKLHLFENCEDPDTFFRSALRGLLTDHCLRNLDMRKLPRTPQYYYHHDDDDDPEEDILSKQGLPYLLMKGVYTDAFILHDESADNFKESQKFAGEEEEKNGDLNEADRSMRDDTAMYNTEVIETYGDPRHDLNIAWPSVRKFQPLWMVRNYFGEEIALYFAWAGLFIATLVIPMAIGIAVFIYGLYCNISQSCGNTTVSGVEDDVFNSTTTTVSEIEVAINFARDLLTVTKEAFDNNATPWYAVSICIWGTLFLELWKRKNAVLAYEWDVHDFEDVEPDRPEYFGTATRKDPVTLENIPFYPFKYKCMKYGVSFGTFLFMLCVVFCILSSVILYRVILTVNFCTTADAASCFVVTTICSSLLNALAILILGKVYEKLAVVLTNWENHRTPSAYRNALIIKLFAFQFANCYSSLFYIAFFRDDTIIDLENGIFGLGSGYSDKCGGSCMPDLSFQVLVLIVIKPIPRILKDVILPWAQKKAKVMCMKKKSSSVDPENAGEEEEEDLKTKFLETERKKPPLKDFTLNEYTEKTIQYGFIALFAAAMPLAPLIVILFNTLDRVLDSKRLLWMYRRPVANIAQNIGMWHNIMEFLNIAAVITNAFLIAFVSDWGKKTFQTSRDRLYAVLVFEHIVFILKYSLAIIIPDVPHKIRIAMRKEKFTVAKILETGVFVKDFNGKSMDGSSKPSSASPQRGAAGNERSESAKMDAVTARNVNLHHRKYPQQNVDPTEGGYTGDAENDSPCKETQLSPVREPTQPYSQQSGTETVRSTPSKSVNLDYGPDGSTYLMNS